MNQFGKLLATKDERMAVLESSNRDLVWKGCPVKQRGCCEWFHFCVDVREREIYIYIEIRYRYRYRYRCRYRHRCPFLIGWLINRGVCLPL
jgi:hypothetical protein